MKILEAFILQVPHPFLKKIAYAWLGVIFFWHWPPVVSGVFMGIMLLGLLMMIWQERAWEARIRREFQSTTAIPYTDHSHARRTYQIRNLLLVLMASGLLGWLLHGLIGIRGLQWFLVLAGYMLLYKDAVLFGAAVTYIVTDQGIGIRVVPGDYRPFFKFSEIRQAVRTKPPQNIPLRWDVLAPQKHPREGILLLAADPGGFSKEIQGEVLLAPTDIDGFLRKLAGYVPVRDEL